MSEKSVKSNKKSASPKGKKSPATKSESGSPSESHEASPKSVNESGKSSKESVGGKDAVHYGFFSNVKTPEYRTGWDDIWSKTKKPGKSRKKEKKEPLILEIKFDELPPTIQEALADAVRVKMKKSRISYDSREKKGGVSWNLSCEVKS